MSTILKERQVKRTRKDRRCDWCGDWVKAGDASVSMSAIWDGDFSSTRYHPECHKAWQDTDWREYESWEFHQQYRGRPLGFEDCVQRKF